MFSYKQRSLWGISKWESFSLSVRNAYISFDTKESINACQFADNFKMCSNPQTFTSQQKMFLAPIGNEHESAQEV